MMMAKAFDYSPLIHAFQDKEQIPALLSETPETIRIAMEVMEDDPEKQNLVRMSASQILKEVLQSGISIPQLEEKLQALGVSESRNLSVQC